MINENAERQTERINEVKIIQRINRKKKGESEKKERKRKTDT